MVNAPRAISTCGHILPCDLSALYTDQLPKMRLDIITIHSTNICVPELSVPINPKDIKRGIAAQ